MKIILNQDYKSFKKESIFELQGDLIILTGENGSGKSQLLDIIFGYQKQQSNQIIDRHVESDNGELFYYNHIILKTFKEIVSANLSFGAFSETSNQVIMDYIELYRIIQQYNFETDNYDIKGFRNLIGMAKEFTEHIKNIRKDNFQNLEANDIELIVKDNNLKILYDDYFDSILLNNLFLKDAQAIQYYKAHNDEEECKTKLEKLNKNLLWKHFNQLFEDFGFNYRFNEDYETDINGLIKPISLKFIDGTQIHAEQLSDGEKSLFSLVVSAILSDQVKDENKIKILLLDEYDATFNPSLINAFYIIIEKFYIKRGIKVILTTHNPITLAFAPLKFYDESKNLIFNTKFYEIKKYSESNARLFKIDKIKKSSEYVIAIEKMRESELVIDSIIKINNVQKPILLVEGETDKIILQSLWNLIYPEMDISFNILHAEGANNIFNIFNHSQLSNSNRILALFDYDTKGREIHGKLNNLNFKKEYDYKSNKTKNLQAILLNVPNNRKTYVSSYFTQCCFLSIEHLFSNKELKKFSKLKTLISNIKILEITNEKKMDFAKKVQNNEIDLCSATKENFKILFERIYTILNT